MASFKVPCPSCEHQVTIKSEAQIGQKAECSKCKYRFKVEEPVGGVVKEADKGDKKKKAAAPGDKKKSKKTVAIVVGVLAVAILAAVGFAVMGGKGDNKGKGGGGGGAGGTYKGGGTEPEPDEKKDDEKKDDTKKDVPKKPVAGASDKEASNLLPAQTVALYRFDVDKVRQTPAAFVLDRTTLEMIRASFGIDADQVATYYHAFVGDTREPFGLIRLKSPVFPKDVLAGMAPTASSKPVKKKYTLHAFKSNPLVSAVSNSLAFGALFGDLYEKLPPPPGNPKDPTAVRPTGMCIYDSQHILVGDHALLEKFLTELDDKGYPKFQSATGTPAAGVALAERPLYLSIDPKMKRAVMDLGGETASPPAVIYVEKYAQGGYDPKLLKSDYQPVAAVLDPVLSRTKYLGASLISFTPNQLIATVRLVMSSESAAFEAVKEQLAPNLTPAAWALGTFLNTQVEFRNYTAGGMTIPGVGIPGMGIPGMGIPGMGIPGMGSPPGTGMPPGMGIPGMGIPGMGGQPYPGTGTPGTPTGPGTGQPVDPNMMSNPLVSHVDLGLTDQTLTVALELNWSNETYQVKIAPRLIGVMNTIKGKMAVFASDLAYHGLVAAVPKMSGGPGLPRGTADRKLTDASRLGLKYPPHTRVSFFAEMLPYLGRDGLQKSINPNLAWFEGDNLKAGEAWVPELLVPTYPHSAWRATSRLVSDGRVLGGTNYVGIAGAGLDAARLDPSNPDHAKKVGIVGYDWGSKIADVKDGLSNTIYMLQTPPGLQQPWIAGGGATVRGLDEANPMRGFSHTFGTPDGKPGTFALMGDGSVRFVPATINPKILVAMSTRAGMEDLADLNTHAPKIEPPKKPEPEPEPEPEPKPKAKDDPKKSGAVEIAPPPREKL